MPREKNFVPKLTFRMRPRLRWVLEKRGKRGGWFSIGKPCMFQWEALNLAPGCATPVDGGYLMNPGFKLSGYYM